jgi:hypothetical protein
VTFGPDISLSQYWSRYRDIPYIRYTRYRVCPDIWIPDIGTYPISGVCNIVPDIGFSQHPSFLWSLQWSGFNIRIYQYRDTMSRYWVLARFQMYTDTYSYILVHNRTYLYILIHTCTYYHTKQCTSNQAGFALRWRTVRVAAARLCRELLTASFLSVVSSMVRPPRRGLPSPNCHSHGLTS